MVTSISVPRLKLDTVCGGTSHASSFVVCGGIEAARAELMQDIAYHVRHSRINTTAVFSDHTGGFLSDASGGVTYPLHEDDIRKVFDDHKVDIMKQKLGLLPQATAITLTLFIDNADANSNVLNSDVL
jgi:hypothetical protein